MLSIIIPTRNEEQHLPQLLESLKRQTIPEGTTLEIIVADADSKDNTREIAISYGCKVVQGGLPAQGRNAGAAAAQGEELLFLDADATLPRGFLFRFLTEARQRDLDVVGCSLKVVEPSLLFRFGIFLWNGYFWASQKVFQHAANCIYAKRWIHERIGGFDERIKFGEDCVYARAAAKVGRFGFLFSSGVFASPRRIKTEGGALKFFRKYIGAEFRMVALRKNIMLDDSFEYSFDHSKQDP